MLCVDIVAGLSMITGSGSPDSTATTVGSVKVGFAIVYVGSVRVVSVASKVTLSPSAQSFTD